MSMHVLYMCGCWRVYIDTARYDTMRCDRLCSAIRRHSIYPNTINKYPNVCVCVCLRTYMNETTCVGSMYLCIRTFDRYSVNANTYWLNVFYMHFPLGNRNNIGRPDKFVFISRWISENVRIIFFVLILCFISYYLSSHDLIRLCVLFRARKLKTEAQYFIGESYLIPFTFEVNFNYYITTISNKIVISRLLTNM